jgi:hypothetical protein
MFFRFWENLFYRPPRVAVLLCRVPLLTNLPPLRALNRHRDREAALHPHLGRLRQHRVDLPAHRQLRELPQLLRPARRVALPMLRRLNVHLHRGAPLVRRDRSQLLRGLLAFHLSRAVRRVLHHRFRLLRDHLLRRTVHVVGRTFRQVQVRGLNPLLAIRVHAPQANLQLGRVRRGLRFRLFVRVVLQELKPPRRKVRLNRAM